MSMFVLGRWDGDPIRGMMTDIMMKYIYFGYFLGVGTLGRAEGTPMADPETEPSKPAQEDNKFFIVI
jgi:hypothetical protein